MFKTRYRIKIEQRENGLLYIPQHTYLCFWRDYHYTTNGIRVTYGNEEDARDLIDKSKVFRHNSKINKTKYINV